MPVIVANIVVQFFVVYRRSTALKNRRRFFQGTRYLSGRRINNLAAIYTAIG